MGTRAAYGFSLTAEEERVAELFHKYVKAGDHLYVHPEIPPKKLQNARNVFAPVADREAVLGLADGTVFGSAKEGLVLTVRRLYWTVEAMSSKGDSCAYDELGSVSIDSSIINRGLNIAGRSTRMPLATVLPDDLQRLADFLNAVRTESVKVWHLGFEGQQRGPFDVREISAMRARKDFDPAKCLVWKEGMADWLPFLQVPELSGRPAGPPPLPPAGPPPLTAAAPAAPPPATRPQPTSTTLAEPGSGKSRLLAKSGGVPLPHWVGVAWGESVEVLLPAGTLTPAKNETALTTRRNVPGSSPSPLLRVPVVAGEEATGGAAPWLLGTLVIPANRRKKDVPAGSAAQVLLEATAAGTVRVKVFLALLDEEFEGVYALGRKPPDLQTLRAEFERERKRHQAAAQWAAGGSSETAQAFQSMAQNRLLEAAESALRQAESDPVAAAGSWRPLLALQEGLDAFEELLATQAEGDSFLNSLGSLYGPPQ